MTTQRTKSRLPRPVSLLLRPWEEAVVVIVGVGGTGSWLAPHVARLACVLQARGKKIRLIFIDPDVVEEKNIYRQNFCDADLAQDAPLHKASSLSFRLGLALGVNASAICEEFDPYMLDGYPHRIYGHDRSTERITIVVSCVDNAAARKSVFKVLEANRPYEAPSFWVLDCGNFPANAGDECGQVYLGSAATPEALEYAFGITNRCLALPSPALQAPDLLIARPEELAQSPLSCAEITRVNEQGLMINPLIASWAASYLFAMLVTGDLRLMGTSINLTRGKVDSDYITPEQVAKVIGKEVSFFKKKR